jgi:hypothetical protein
MKKTETSREKKMDTSRMKLDGSISNEIRWKRLEEI